MADTQTAPWINIARTSARPGTQEKKSRALLVLHCDSKTGHAIPCQFSSSANNDFSQINPYSQNHRTPASHTEILARESYCTSGNHFFIVIPHAELAEGGGSCVSIIAPCRFSKSKVALQPLDHHISRLHQRRYRIPTLQLHLPHSPPQ